MELMKQQFHLDIVGIPCKSGTAALLDTVTRLHAAITKALNIPEIRSKNRKAGFFAVERTPEPFAAQLARDVDISLRAIRAAGLKPE